MRDIHGSFGPSSLMRHGSILLAALLAASLLSAQGKIKPPPYEILEFHSEEVRKGAIEESGDLRLYSLLPPSYASSPARRYPVVYCFHGYGDAGSELINVGRTSVLEAMRGGACPEFIMVCVEGANVLGGSFYADSPATGNWASMVTKEVIPYVDAKYRTMARPEARGLAGFSMGGFGAWSIGLANADLVSWVWACCPGALAPGGLAKAIPTWDGGFMDAYGAAFAPDLGLKYPFARKPTLEDGSVKDDDVARSWYAGFGDIEGKLRGYLSKPARLRAVRFDCAENDSYRWIPEGTIYVAEAMRRSGIEVAIKADWKTGHYVGPAQISLGFIPFFKAAFDGLRSDT